MRLPILRPCHENWDTMTPDEAGRFCQACAHEVHDLSAMTQRQALRLLAARKGMRTCVRVRVRPDGHAAFKPEPGRMIPVAAAVALAACTPHTPEAQRLAPEIEVDANGSRLAPTVVIPETTWRPSLAPGPCPPQPPSPVKPKRPKDDKLDLIEMGYME